MGFLKKCSCFVYYELKKYDLFCWWIFPRWSDMYRRKDVRKCPPLFYPKSTEYAVTEKEQETKAGTEGFTKFHFNFDYSGEFNCAAKAK